MDPDALKQRILEEFSRIGLLECLDVGISAFRELPRFFEASHLAMHLVLENASALAAASTIAATMKRELEQHGIELEYQIRVQWKIVSLDCSRLARLADPLSSVSSNLQAVLASGAATRTVSLQITPAARIWISHYASQLPPTDRSDAVRRLLQACIDGQLSPDSEEYWDPVLYPTRNIDEASIARLCTVQEGFAEPEITSKV